ncbi:QWRF motif-containing protein 2-like [Salvia splendens]|uniref:QWRF motif-containing protein 2-like n=1 Tax=Salvia splendens TaxID=180675 RepID=UPI001C25AB30|nr:QWRF motif-containing protein 2-like [Salvia splendens]XP_041989356.1 QWRF motif-containing protein 2-like [Salvia splendens]
MMVAAVHGDRQSPKTQEEHSRRPPLLPSEKDNSNGVTNNQRKPKSRIVSSRYMSPSSSTSTSNSSSVSSSSSSSRRCPSPLISRNSKPVSNGPSASPKRSVSVDRRRPAAARTVVSDLESKNGNAAEVSAAAKLLVTSTRSLSVSFQGEAFSLPISKTKAPPPSPNVRKGTPERRSLRGGGDQVENSKPSDHNRWPARNRVVNPLSRSLDCRGNGGDRSKVVGSANGIRTLQQLMNDERRPSLDGRLSLDLGDSDLIKAAPDGNSVNNELSLPCDLTASDSDSVSSDSTSGVQEFGVAVNGRNGPRRIAVSARFWQETNSRLRRLQDPGSPLSMSPTSKVMMPPNLKRSSSDGHGLLMSPPARGGIRPASPSKLMTPVGSSPSRGHSPSRIRNAVSTINNNFNETPSVLSFAVDVRRAKVGESRIFDAHLVRLLYNRNLQWRFVNARTEAVMLVQKQSAEKNLWNAWIAISDLRDTVTKKSHRLQLLRQKLRLASILKGQMTLLEDWASLENDHSVSLLGAIEALKASTLRLPVVGGATANVLGLKDAIGSAVDVMHGMASSIYSLLPVVEEVNLLVTELAQVSAKERALLEQCTDFISLLAAMQDRATSLRTHVIQHNCVRSA